MVKKNKKIQRRARGHVSLTFGRIEIVKTEFPRFTARFFLQKSKISLLKFLNWALENVTLQRIVCAERRAL